ncbi:MULTISPECIES: uracil-DNA glycosylase [Brucella/Ochrobactrum group]|jgi:uracil-DNA glycosylase family 4|uniref:Type-5 uracil-DNA glycosylase n=1 Tax=Brucella pseudintermedia TaxID=370111 RepID=A0ABY5UAG4_9HYPH|nr:MULTISPECIES: uracil-DNA glycosylase [Brucella/Ochrobactrum group]KAB2680495.1 uracil-DNA glycosylase [Brucella pseudintermedia]MCO7726556.1 uracil-DNA glycosylase [Brucella intermedia]TWH02958.1 uracil-DNA glycosylase family 4 [Ochrobactrum sp. J50]UWL60333.1 uracil-DNA glycosylase [Brucella pseudintermedia]WPM80750.1 uracil-DNA glycosylase [Brucella pseudintermedia]
MISEPSPNCHICPRLHAFLQEWRRKEPSWHNAPVPPFLPADDADVRLLIVGLAPGLRGANRTGRPFTGDYAGDLLYSTLCEFGFATGKFEARPDDSLRLLDASIVNAVRCVPPENKPIGSEINNCRQFLSPMLTRFPNLQAVVTLGTIAHQSTVRALGAPVARHPFGHDKASDIGNLRIFSSYHCSRYNTNTGRLTDAMFRTVFRNVREYLNQKSA